ncbi:uncharacterized protein IL334_000709 [Kwoniella shivajii]|uniref:PH domain-containing protein n=1 Tax=Kwoniella shivajii TaxID=564305 RepID=A0ABZ1CRE2_9TREE|nr:hypothetical protein IL334_000709 [Kwoniella shivajii]
MSVDLSDPQVSTVRDKILDTNDPTTWFLLHYAISPTSITPSSSLSQSITLLASGREPVLPKWHENLTETNEDVLFGYGEIAGKGLVLLFLKDKVGGVKRARAVVHARAVASLFPDYSALITIAHLSQLTEELITERLALNQPSSSSSSSTIPKPKYSIPGYDHPNPLSPLAPGGPMPYLPSTGSSRSVSAEQPGSSSGNAFGIGNGNAIANGSGMNHPSPKRYGDISNNYDSPTRNRITSLNSTSTPSRQNTSSPGPAMSAPIALGSPVKVESKGISSADYFGKDDPSSPRSRKTSFGVRLKNTFRSPSYSNNNSFDEASSPSLQSQTPQTQGFSHERTQGSPGSPKSPKEKEGRFKNNSIVKAFHRRRSSTNPINTPPDSPRVADHEGQDENGQADVEYAPPVPPKDLPQTSPLESDEDLRIPPQSETFISSSANSLGHGQPNDIKSNTLSPSPSARQVLYEARQKSLSAETEIQERFRRDQEERNRVNDNGRETDEESVRLAYDQSESEHEDEPYSIQQVQKTDNRGINDTDGDQATPTIYNGGQVAQAEKMSQAAEDHAERAAAIRREEDKVRQLAEAEEAAAVEKQRLEEERIEAERRIEEERMVEEERIRIERLRLEEEARKEEEEKARIEAEDKAQREAEAVRIEAEDKAKLEAEQARSRAEEAAEVARIEAEQIARRQAEEAELVRVKKMQEDELARKEIEEKARLHKEEEERIKVESEIKRKEGIRQGLETGKKEGGIMLRGWVTVQTYKSMTWRRRYFRLLPNEMQLYKAEADPKPIQTIYIGKSSSVSERYEESQVKDSFKVISDGPKGEEEFFLFTDSGEDKETVLEGLRLCMA